MIGGFELVTVSGDPRQHFLGSAPALAERGGGERCATRDHTGKPDAMAASAARS